MKNRRRPVSQITPVIEDAGLFKRELRDVQVNLVPVLNRSSRGDLVVKGIVRPEAVIEVIFAGRRRAAAGGLTSRLKQLRMQAVRSAMTGHDAMHGIRQQRLPVQIRGTWRLRFEPDDSGWEVKSYQLIAAQWAYFGLEGEIVQGGWLPEVLENRLLDRSRAERQRLAASRGRQAVHARPPTQAPRG